MGRFIDWSNVVAKYPDVSKLNGASELEDAYIPDAENFIQGSLAAKYSNEVLLQSQLVKGLMVDQVYRDIQLTRQPKKAEALGKAIAKTVDNILNKKVVLVSSSGEILSHDRSPIWSSTENYTPVFGMSDYEDSFIDPDQLESELDSKL
jgi:hypothetical protein